MFKFQVLIITAVISGSLSYLQSGNGEDIHPKIDIYELHEKGVQRWKQYREMIKNTSREEEFRMAIEYIGKKILGRPRDRSDVVENKLKDHPTRPRRRNRPHRNRHGSQIDDFVRLTDMEAQSPFTDPQNRHSNLQHNFFRINQWNGAKDTTEYQRRSNVASVISESRIRRQAPSGQQTNVDPGFDGSHLSESRRTTTSSSIDPGFDGSHLSESRRTTSPSVDPGFNVPNRS